MEKSVPQRQRIIAHIIQPRLEDDCVHRLWSEKMPPDSAGVTTGAPPESPLTDEVVGGGGQPGWRAEGRPRPRVEQLVGLVSTLP